MPLESKYKQKNENRRFGFIKSLYMQQCSMRGCIRPLASVEAVFDFQSNQNELSENIICTMMTMMTIRLMGTQRSLMLKDTGRRASSHFIRIC